MRLCELLFHTKSESQPLAQGRVFTRLPNAPTVLSETLCSPPEKRCLPLSPLPSLHFYERNKKNSEATTLEVSSNALSCNLIATHTSK